MKRLVMGIAQESTDAGYLGQFRRLLSSQLLLPSHCDPLTPQTPWHWKVDSGLVLHKEEIQRSGYLH